MSDPLRGVVVCHADVAAALVKAAEEISGVRGLLVPVSNAGCNRGTLEQRVLEAVDGQRAVVFVDMPSSSCLFAVARLARTERDLAVVTGVNLAMLLEFLLHAGAGDGTEPVAEAARRAAEAGQLSVRVP